MMAPPSDSSKLFEVVKEETWLMREWPSDSMHFVNFPLPLHTWTSYSIKSGSVDEVPSLKLEDL